MTHQELDPLHPFRFSLCLPWLLFGVGFFEFVYAAGSVAGEVGDPPNTKNDHWQRVAIIATPLFLNISVIVAALRRQWLSAILLAIAAAAICGLGWSREAAFAQYAW